ncbi:MAG TPA: C4-type zinc ribbon domain-containing protein [Myxococcota bacterium]|nr:C4-type zinc ribbon domain-containing protein [Myxococcota bacterium]
MQDQLLALEKLQEIDSQIWELDKARGAIPAKINDLKASLDAIRSILAKERAELEAAERYRREQNGELESSSNMIDAAKHKLGAVRNSKEFHAISKELEAQKRINGEKEEEILKLMEVIEQANRSIKAHEKEFNDLLKIVMAEEQAGQTRMAELDARIAALNEQRGRAMGGISAPVLRRYDHIRHKKAGLAVVRVQGGQCRGCNMQIPPQLFNILMRQKSMELCPSCHRIMIYRSPEQVAEDEGAARA